MPKTNLQEKATELKGVLGDIDKFWDEAKDTEVKDFTDEQKQSIDGLNKKAQELNDEIQGEKGYDAERAKQDVMRAALNQPVGRPDFGGQPNAQKKTSPGAEFVNDPKIRNWIESELGLKGEGAALADGIKIHSPAVEAKGIIMSGSDSGGAFVRRDYDMAVDLPLRALTIVDLITKGRTGSNLVEYVRTKALTRAAAIVPEATDTSGAGYTTAAKPQSHMAFEIIQAAVKTIAVWMPITRQILSDAPQLESEINNFEEADLLLALEEEIVSGIGGSSHFIGLENTPGITPYARLAADDELMSTRRARTRTMTVGRAKPTGYLFNPYDWETIDLLRSNTNGANTGMFYMGGPVIMGVEMLWGLPVAQSEVIPQGTYYTGDLKQAKLWDREQPTRRITDSHSDFFTHNLIAILTELRAAFGVRRPAAIIKGDLVVGSNS